MLYCVWDIFVTTALLLGQSRIGWRLAVGFGEIVAVFNALSWFLGSVGGDFGIGPSYLFVLVSVLVGCRTEYALDSLIYCASSA